MSVERPVPARLRATSLRLLAAVAFLAGGPAVRAETPAPAKPRSTRKMFDFTRPRPGEMLANPAKGAGAPPQLKEFAPNEAMHISQSETADAASPQGSGSSPKDDADKAAVGARSAAAGPVVQPNAAQKQLPEQIARLGIEGFLAQPPQAASEQEQKDAEALRKQIAASLAIWQALYGKASEPGAGAAPAGPVKSEPKP